MLFTENETDFVRIFKFPEEPGRTFKDGFHEFVIRGNKEAISKQAVSGTERRPRTYQARMCRRAKKSACDCGCLPPIKLPPLPFGLEFDRSFAAVASPISPMNSATSLLSKDLTPQARSISRQAAAGLLWSKQFYFYSVKDWLRGDPDQPPPPAGHQHVRNVDWQHLFNRDVISMPDKWEYPWYAAWDLAFHMLPFSKLDPEFAKSQLILVSVREWYMHPNGQIPAYEFAFSDVNPPVHAWACWRVYKMTAPRGKRDRVFLARIFQKLLINFTWWVNRKDIEGNNLFSGGFLGLDNIGVFDRSKPLPGGGVLEQADGTAWMAFYCSTMLAMALELAVESPEYEDIASKFFEHFVAIVDAMNSLGGTGLWDEADGFYYDQLHVQGQDTRLKIRSIVGLIPRCSRPSKSSTMNRSIGCPALKSGCSGFSTTGKTWRRISRTVKPIVRMALRADRRAADGSWPSRRESVSNECCVMCSTKESFCRTTESALSRGSTRIIRLCCTRMGTSTVSTTSRANRRPGCSAATRTGGAQSGCRINLLLIDAAWKPLSISFTATNFSGRVPGRLGPKIDAERMPLARSNRAWRESFWPIRRAAGLVTAKSANL